MEYAKFGDLDYFQKKLIKKSSLSETLLAYITKQNHVIKIFKQKKIHKIQKI